ncbi:helix-turn-helix transcriptional regulator [Sporomusa sp. KB1]|jgi:hypothetical protein|uniref:helix-turn-helix domain-containing protein n=1 Tax=Sporomusa sp. KB1 TaxID=943346 RepID=UPI0011A2B88A|nr:helix-turn-helix transcriptional regulator [Sporomusa sp. KB1]TWH48506.1 putative transcriptional regulator [Sporomusa sp. KB1]
MLADARNEAGLSLECVSEITNVPRKAISKYEVAPEEAPPERILKLAEAYHNKDVLEWYCTDVCPIGKEQHCKVVVNGLTSAAMTFLTELDDVQSIQKLLMRVTCDGKIDASEIEDTEKFMTEIEHIERAIHALKSKVAQEMDRLEKEKSPVHQHRRVS